jgi:hypothetical protein
VSIPNIFHRRLTLVYGLSHCELLADLFWLLFVIVVAFFRSVSFDVFGLLFRLIDCNGRFYRVLRDAVLPKASWGA